MKVPAITDPVQRKRVVMLLSAMTVFSAMAIAFMGVVIFTADSARCEVAVDVSRCGTAYAVGAWVATLGALVAAFAGVVTGGIKLQRGDERAWVWPVLGAFGAAVAMMLAALVVILLRP